MRVALSFALMILAGCQGSDGVDSKAQAAFAERGGMAAILRRSPDEALAILDGAQTAEAERLRAVAWLQKHDLAQSRAHLEKAVAMGGGAQIHADFARLELIRGDVHAAQGWAARALEENPDLPAALLISAEVEAMLGRTDVALGHYRRALRLYPDNLAALLGRAQMLAASGRQAELRQALTPLLARIPHDPEVIALQGRINSPGGARQPRS